MLVSASPDVPHLLGAGAELPALQRDRQEHLTETRFRAAGNWGRCPANPALGKADPAGRRSADSVSKLGGKMLFPQNDSEDFQLPAPSIETIAG
ncbi:hypothetical protein [Crossiella cryophila]|uniref:Uncharacterized protein n=1 Tax=Crossiella cryophila TaxID=43355 RepID=A0A7W7FVC4_9PSEU|nr:hypothetical protein [Crossiella cryophila]MBB4678353.1 hypothetical protein [Crossiella cryophila]